MAESTKSAEAAAERTVAVEKPASPVETAAISVWVDEAWLKKSGEQVRLPKALITLWTDGKAKRRSRILYFHIWGSPSFEEVPVTSTLSDKTPTTSRLWSRDRISFDLNRNVASMPQSSIKIQKTLLQKNLKEGGGEMETVQAVNRQSSANELIRLMELIQFPTMPKMQKGFQNTLKASGIIERAWKDKDCKI